MPSIDAFVMEPQILSQLCWAAVTVSVNHLRKPGSTLKICDVTQISLSPPPDADCCANLSACNRNGPLAMALQQHQVPVSPPLGRALTFAEIQTEIDAGRVICLGIQWPFGGIHNVVIAGYEDDSLQTVHVKDPLYDPTDPPYLTLVSNYQLGGGQWIETIKIV
jgi:Papain-like cysteine protease AvrRpt2